jgi:hypothetical protein
MSEPARVVDFPLAPALARRDETQRAELLAVRDDGRLHLRLTDGREQECDWLETGAAVNPPLAAGDTLLVLPQRGRDAGVVLGRIGRYRTPVAAQPQARVTIEATDALSLKCGDASIELRADGKLTVKGEDVLVRARGTQRIKAGTVNIN